MRDRHCRPATAHPPLHRHYPGIDYSILSQHFTADKVPAQYAAIPREDRKDFMETPDPVREGAGGGRGL